VGVNPGERRGDDYDIFADDSGFWPVFGNTCCAKFAVSTDNRMKGEVMANILFISRYYPPEKAAAAVCVSETAKRLVKLGHQVTVLTTVPNYPTGIVPPQYRGHLLQEEVLDGVRVVRVWSYIRANEGFLGRILAQFSFGCLAPFLGGKAIGRPDVIIVGSPPLFNVIAVRILAWLKHCPFIFWVADIWPESAVQLGALRNRILIRLSEWLEWSTYQRASLVWVVTEGMRDTLIRRGLSPMRIILIPNGVDTSEFFPQSQAQARLALGWDDRFTILYAGTHGFSHGLTTVLDAAELIRDRDDICFVLVGDGAEKTNLMAQAQKRDLKNITFLDPLPHNKIPQLLAAADVCLAHARKVQLFEGMLPIKMYEAMACARPILLALNGEARRIAEQEAGAALYVEPENGKALASAVLYLYEHSEEAELLGWRGRAYVEAHFDYDQLTETLETRLEVLLKEKISSSQPETSISASIPVIPRSAPVTERRRV
jgi:colanic acid biosynthesis glycosyl transferase WcaI